MSDISTAPRGDLIILIYDLIEQNNGLKEQISKLTAQVAQLRKQNKALKNQKSFKEKDPPSFVKPSIRKKKKKKTRKKRVLNFARKRQKPDKYVFHSYDTCPDCNGVLGKPSVAHTRQVIDIPTFKFKVTEHVFFKRWCTNCKTRIYPSPKLKGVTVGKQRFGINIQSLVSTLSEEFRQPLNKIKSFLSIAYHLEISEGGLVRLLASTSAKGENDYNQIKAALKKSDVVYADETGSREAGINGYQWSFSNNKYQLIWYHKRRNKDVVREFVGDSGKQSTKSRKKQKQNENEEDMFQGVLVTDFLGSYNTYNGFHQRCWVHFLRDIKKLKKEIGSKHPPLNIWAKRIKQIYTEAKEWSGPNPKLPFGLQAQERIEKEAYFKDKLKKVCKPHTLKETPMTTLSQRAITFLPEMFTFIRFEGIKPDNNQAERALRHSVIRRKISGGTRSAKGSHTREVLASLFGTWRLQGLNPLQQTKLMLARSPCQEE